MYIFDIKRYAINDGPGIRTTIFMKGCPLRCVWCHNPEGWTQEPQILYKKSKCIGCQTCVEVCPQDALALTPERAETKGPIWKGLRLKALFSKETVQRLRRIAIVALRNVPRQPWRSADVSTPWRR